MSFESTFEAYVLSGYQPPDGALVSDAVDWYNAHLMEIGIACSAPVKPVTDKNADTFMWAYATGLVAVAATKARLVRGVTKSRKEQSVAKMLHDEWGGNALADAGLVHRS